MNRSAFLPALCLVVAATLGSVAGAAASPNFALILVDDMGFSDPGCYGGEIETPNLDRLASNGLRFTQFYNTGRCWPTRASLMTGRYPHDVGHAMIYGDRAPPGYRGTSRERAVMKWRLTQIEYVISWATEPRGLDGKLVRSSSGPSGRAGWR